jgi:AraC-like DNA-binding protein
MVPSDRARTWRPAVPGVHEVLHARFVRHAYPAHTHSEWTLLLVDTGAVDYRLGGRAQIAGGSAVTLLPPGVAHDGRPVGPEGFRKRVVYLDQHWLPDDLIGLSVDRPAEKHVEIVRAVRRLHGALASPGDELEAEATLLDVRAALLSRLRRRPVPDARPRPALAAELRDLLDSRLVDGVTLAEAGRLLGAHPGSLGRAFHAAFGIAPHAYLVGRRVDRARHLLHDGWGIAEAAVASGFYDQAHLTRHFTRVLGMTPGGYRGA